MTEGAAKAPELKIRIVIDKEGSKVADEMRQLIVQPSEEHGKEAAKGWMGGFGGGMKAGSVFVGNLYMELFHKAAEYAKEVVTEPIHAFMESAKQVKQLAGTFAMLDESGAPLARIKAIASETKDELEDLGMKAGIADDVLVNTFDNIIERGNKTIDQAKELTEQFAYAGRAIPNGAEGISEAYSNIEAGIVRAKNPIVGMIASTHLLKGNAKQVAAEMQKMSTADQLALAEKAIGRMADKMKDAPLGFNQIKTSLGVFKENLLETMGEPMTKGLNKAATQFRAIFFDAHGEATAMSKTLMKGAAFAGETLAKYFEYAVTFIEGFMAGFSTFDEEVKLIWGELFDNSDFSWKSMMEAAKLTATVLGVAVKGFAAGIGTLIYALEKVLKYTVYAAGFLLTGAGQVTGSDTLKEAGTKTMQIAYSGERQRLLDEAKSTGGGSKDDLKARMSSTAFMTYDKTAMAEMEAAFAERNRVQHVVDDAQIQAQHNSASNYIAAYGEAAKAHDEAALKNIAKFLGANQSMASAIGEMAPDIIEGGIKGFIEKLKEVGNSDMAKMIEAGQKRVGQLAIGKNPVINQNFSGNINIKQDFRDQDPDRVVSLIKKGLGREAANRSQARTAGAFGW